MRTLSNARRGIRAVFRWREAFLACRERERLQRRLDRDNFGFLITVITRLFSPKPPKRGHHGPLLDLPRLKLRAIAGMTDMFSSNSEWCKMSSLRDPRISGVEPLVSNHSFGAIFEHAKQLF
ncbi:hypothetical protein D6C13_11835 [Rahnella woolbedingensis]|uniref:Uncharacterized protein n=1 Tax=Rahnella woolbedingensis TaxID=1510574 RepID=A0A419N8Z7_9GAMM|nr:hypothetical protein D6C13_11835 [Rahnella woolbedingensis]